jgi:hypothetical protein
VIDIFIEKMLAGFPASKLVSGVSFGCEETVELDDALLAHPLSTFA